MAHEIDELAPGIHAAAFARQGAWHRLGTTVPAEFTATEALEYAHLAGWDVRKLPLYRQEEGVDNGTVQIPDRFATVRTNPVTGGTEYLGVVGGAYKPIQNEAHLDLLDTLVDESGAHFDTAGSLRGGREVFVGMKLPDSIQIGGADQIDVNLIALNSHDGSSAFRFIVSPIRVVCANTQAAAIASAQASFSIRHTSNAGGRIQEAREALGMTFKYLEAYEAEGNRMVSEAVTAGWVDSFLHEVFQVAQGERHKASKRQRENLDGTLALWRDSETMAGIKDTRWGAYQAVTEFIDHLAPVRGADADLARANRVVTSYATTKLKERAFTLATV